MNQKRPELWDEIMGEEFLIHHPLIPAGRSAYRDAMAVLWVAFPDLEVEILDVVAENDRVVVRYADRGTHTGDFLGLEPSGRSYEKHGFTMYRLSEGRLVEAWIQEDDAAFQQQLFG